jgi:hypothetical protein
MVEPPPSPGIARCVGDAGDISELTSGCKRRVVRVESVSAELLGTELEVQSHLVAKVALHSAPMKWHRQMHPQLTNGHGAISSGGLKDAGDGEGNALVRFDFAIELPATGGGDAIVSRAPVLGRLRPRSGDPTLHQHPL